MISVILPIYNIKEYIDKCMDSLFAQTYTDLEILMIDDGSTDGSEKLCDEYALKDSRIKVFHKVNGGLSNARNYGIERANGEYIACIDPDDYVDSDYIEYLYKLIKKYDTKMSICQHRVLYDNGRIIEKGSVGDEKLPAKTCIDRICYHDVIDTSAWAKLYHRSLWEDIRYPDGKVFEDIGTTYKLMLLSGEVAVGYESKYNYFIRGNSIVNGKFKPNKFDLLEMTDTMARDVSAVYPDLKDSVYRRQVYARFSTLNQMIGVEGYDKQRDEIIAYIKNSRKAIMHDKRAPRRDKIAMIVLCMSYKLYCLFWNRYQKNLKG